MISTNVQQNRLNVRINILLDILINRGLALFIRRGGAMNNVICLGELSQKEELLEKKINLASNPIKFLFTAIICSYVVKGNFKKLKKGFESKEYISSIAATSEDDMRKILEQLKYLGKSNSKWEKKLLSINSKFYLKPFLKVCTKTLHKENEFISEKIDDYKLALNNDFFSAAEKIIDGVNSSRLDVSKVKNIGTIV